MALPEEVATVNLTGTYVNLDGTPTVGYLMFEPSPQILKAADSREFVVPKVMQVNLDEGGAFSIVLPANDDPDVTPVDWTYQVTEAFGARRTYSIEIHIAAGPTQNIYDLAPVALSNGTWYLQGDRGPAGGAMLHTTGKPADTVGEDGDEALDYSTGILYLKTGSHWDNGSQIGSVTSTPNAPVVRNGSGGGEFAQVTIDTAPTAASDAVRKDYADALGTPNNTPSSIVRRDTNGVTSFTEVEVTQQTTVASAVRRDYVDPTITKVTASTPTSTPSTLVSRDGAGSVGVAQLVIDNAPASAASATRKDYVDTADTTTLNSAKSYTDNSAGTASNTASTLVRRSSANAFAVSAISGLGTPTTTDNATNKAYVDAADALAVKVAGDIGGTAAAPTVTGGTHHTHTSAQISDATSSATASTVVLRDASANTTLNQLTLSQSVPQTASQATRKDYVDTHTWLSASITDATSAATASMIAKRDAAGRLQVVDPSVAADVATKNYVDSKVAPVTSVAGKTGVVTLASADITDATSSAVTASTLVKRDASGGTIQAYDDLTIQGAVPSNPASGYGRLYLSSTARATILGTTGTSRTSQYSWGSGTTSFPSTDNQAGDTYRRTDIGTNGTVFQYSGIGTQGLAGWIAEGPVICTSTTRPAFTYNGMQIYETDTGFSWIYNSAWQPLTHGAVSGKIWRTAGFSGNLTANTTYTLGFDTARVSGGCALVNGGTATSMLTVPLDGIYALTSRAYASGGGTPADISWAVARVRASVGNTTAQAGAYTKEDGNDRFPSTYDLVPLKAADGLQMTFSTTIVGTNYYGANEVSSCMINAVWIAPLNGATPV